MRPPIALGTGVVEPDEILTTSYDWAPGIQRKVVALVLRDPTLYKALGATVFQARFFSHPPLRLIADEVFKACELGGGTPPSPEMLEQLVRDRLPDFRPPIADAIRKELPLVLTADLSDAPIIRAKVADWAQTQACAEAAIKVAGLVERGAHRNGGGAQILTLFQNALAVGKGADATIRMIGDEEAVLESLTRVVPKTPTGFRAVDRVMRGGAEKGLHVVAGEPKLGKTSFLTQLSVAGARAGLTVFQASGEVTLDSMVGRFVPALTGLNRAEVAQSPEKAVARIRGYRQTGGEIICEYLPGFTVGWLASRVRQLEANGEHIGLIVADYIDLMRVDGKSFTEKRHNQEQICQDLRALGVELGIPVWTAKGVNRQAVGKMVVTKKDLAECFAVAYVADNILALCSTEEEQGHTEIHPTTRETLPKPRIRVFYAAGRESQGEIMIAGYERDNDRQRWREIPGYLKQIEAEKKPELVE